MADDLVNEDPKKSKLYEQESEKIHKQIFDGDKNVFEFKSLHVNLGKAKKYKMNNKEKKQIIRDINVCKKKFIQSKGMIEK
jgi:hypothetical protein